MSAPDYDRIEWANVPCGPKSVIGVFVGGRFIPTRPLPDGKDRELVRRFIEYGRRPKRRPMAWFYRRLGYDIPEFYE